MLSGCPAWALPASLLSLGTAAGVCVCTWRWRFSLGGWSGPSPCQDSAETTSFEQTLVVSVLYACRLFSLWCGQKGEETTEAVSLWALFCLAGCPWTCGWEIAALNPGQAEWKDLLTLVVCSPPLSSPSPGSGEVRDTQGTVNRRSESGPGLLGSHCFSD